MAQRVLQPIDFRPLQSDEDLAVALSFDPDTIRRITIPEMGETWVIKHKIPKRGRGRRGQYRVVWEPMQGQYADFFKTLARRIQFFLPDGTQGRFPHPACHGYVPERSILTNAMQHAGRRWVLNADIRQFFPSIGPKRTESALKAAGVGAGASAIIASIVTIDGGLALGLHPSPIIANLVCLDLDDDLDALARSLGCRYTRYADDITFSSTDCLPAKSDVEAALARHQFSMAPEKFRIAKRGQALFVTGLSVTDDRPRLPKRAKRRMRQELYYCEKFGVRSHVGGTSDDLQSGINKIDGRLRFMRGIEPELGWRWWKLWMRLLRTEGLTIQYPKRTCRPPRAVEWFFDETTIEHGGTPILAVALVATEDAPYIRQKLLEYRRTRLVDPFASGDRSRLEREGLHFTALHPDARAGLVELLARLPMRAFIVFGAVKDPASYRDEYFRFARTVISGRLTSYDRYLVTAIFEENSQIARADLEHLVVREHQESEARAAQRPTFPPEVLVRSKSEEPCFTLPDALLWLWRRYARSEEPQEHERLQFERLRDKIRLIVNVDTDEWFSRRRPFRGL